MSRDIPSSQAILNDLFLLLLLELLLLFELLLHSLDACHHATLLSGLLLLLGVVGLELHEELLLVNGLAQYQHDDDGGERRDKVVVVKTSRVIVKCEDEDDGHKKHHPLHHLLLLGVATCGLLIHGVQGVDDVHDAEEQAEERDVVAQEGKVEVPMQEVVVGREVVFKALSYSLQFSDFSLLNSE